MTVTWQTIVTVAAVVTALSVLVGKYNKGYDFIQRQDKQDEEIKSIKEEQALIVGGVLACLKGLQEQGCDGSVTEAIADFEAYLNKKAHS